MNFESAIVAARSIADQSHAKLGGCIFADDRESNGLVWLMGFEMAGGSLDWYWHVILVDDQPESLKGSVIAIHHRPPQERLPNSRS